MLPLLSTLLIVLIGCAGLAVDVRNGYVVRAALQHAVDDGAVSAQRWSAQATDTPDARVSDVVSGAVAEGLRIAWQGLRSRGVGGISIATATLAGGHLTLSAQARVPTFFLSPFGLRFWVPRVRADVEVQASGAAAGSIQGAGTGLSGETARVQVTLLPPGFEVAGLAGVGPTAAGFEQIGGAGPLATGPGSMPGPGLVLVPGSFAVAPGGGGVIAHSLPETGAVPEPTGISSPGGPPGPPSPASPDDVGIAGACNCDGIVAGDPQTARDILQRMGVTPADPGPFSGDLTSEIGLSEMQSSGSGGAGGLGGDGVSGADGGRPDGGGPDGGDS